MRANDGIELRGWKVVPPAANGDWVLVFHGVSDNRTGDLGHYQDGYLFFDGRIDFQIKLHGYRIEIGDIENNLDCV